MSGGRGGVSGLAVGCEQYDANEKDVSCVCVDGNRFDEVRLDWP